MLTIRRKLIVDEGGGLPLDPAKPATGVFDLSLDLDFQQHFRIGVLAAAANLRRARPRRKVASSRAIHNALAKIYAEAKAAGTKPPNVNEAFALVVKRMPRKHAPRSKVMKELKAFDNQRLSKGARFNPK